MASVDVTRDQAKVAPPGDPRIRALVDKARSGAWNPAVDIDWSAEAVVPDGMDAPSYRQMLSQLYHAEQFAIAACEKMKAMVPSADARAFLDTQIEDEERHAAVYLQYLERFGALDASVPALARIYDAVLGWRGTFCVPLIVLNIAFEAEALIQQRKRIEHLPCPLFREINERIARDESRHAGFGILYLTEAAPAVELAERREALAFIDSLWSAWGSALERKEIPSSGEHLRTSKEDFNRQKEAFHHALERTGFAA